MAADNGTVPDCDKCSMPREQSALNMDAWAVWSFLDNHGRDLDTMAGNPLPIRIEALEIECGRYPDPDAIRWRVGVIEERVLEYRRKQAQKKK